MPGRMDWSRLPPELLQTIAGKLSDIADYVRFRAVCVPWRSAARPEGLPPQLPWLMLPLHPAGDSRRFYSLSGDRVYTLHLPEARGKRIQGSSHGWVLALDRTLSLSLLNPLTRAQIQLPPLISGIGSEDEDHAIPISPGKGSEYLFHRFKGAILISSPSSSSDCLVMSSFLFHPNSGFVFCRPGDRTWTTIDADLLGDFTYYEGKFIAVSNHGRAVTIDADTLAEAPMMMPSLVMNDLDHLYLVVSSSEELLLVLRHQNFSHICYEGPQFEVFQLDVSKQPKWFKVTSIGDSMLFLDGHHALFYGASDPIGFKRNCIYFVDTDHMGNGVFDGPEICRISMFNIGDGSVERLPCYWNTSSKACSCCRATWVAPSLC